MSSFGTDGIRTQIGTRLLRPQELIHLGTVIGQWAQKNNNSTVIIGKDTRASSDFIEAHLIAGLTQLNVHIKKCNIIPTPVLEHTVRSTQDSIGIMITASHNQYHDNGIKLFTYKSGKINKQDEQEITDLLSEKNFSIDYEQLGTVDHHPDAQKSYFETIKSYFKKDFLNNITIAVDCANGAFSHIAPEILSSFGAIVIPLHTNPNGKNINKECGAVSPQSLRKAVVNQKIKIGLAFDGDGDRLTIVSKNGALLNGDDTLALLLKHPKYSDTTALVGTIMSNQGLIKYAEKNNKKFIRTSVGDKYITQELKKNKLLIGGEPSGHTILTDYSETSDGLFTALRVLESIIYSNNWDLTTFDKYPHLMLSIPVKKQEDLRKEPYARIIKESEELLRSGRVIVRYSGTEPVLRIMVEDENEINAESVGRKLSQSLAALL